jgi:hypothetical protein
LGFPKKHNDLYESLIYWNIEYNDEAFRLNINPVGLRLCYVTPDEQFLALDVK